MEGIEVIFGPGNRRVWRANGFYLEQLPPRGPAGRLGDETQLVISRRPTATYKPWSPDDPETHEVEESNKIRPEDVLKEVPLARIPSGRFCFVYPIELDEAGRVPARIDVATGWELPAAEAEPDPTEALPRSELGPDKLPMAPRSKKEAAAKAN